QLAKKLLGFLPRERQPSQVLGEYLLAVGLLRIAVDMRTVLAQRRGIDEGRPRSGAQLAQHLPVDVRIGSTRPGPSLLASGDAAAVQHPLEPERALHRLGVAQFLPEVREDRNGAVA